jgi:hypothetical protein
MGAGDEARRYHRATEQGSGHLPGPEVPGFVPMDPRKPAPAVQALPAGTPARAAHRPAAGGRCGCRKFHLRGSGGMFVLVEEAAEAIASADVHMRDRGEIGDRLGQWA